MRYLLLAGLLLSLPRTSWAQTSYVPKDDAAFPASKHFFHYLGDDQPVQDAELRDIPEEAKQMVKLSGNAPPPPAAPHPIEVAESERAYTDGKYAEAAEAVAALAHLEPADPQVLNCYARALYRGTGTRAQSRPVYEKLIALLDRYGHENAEVSSIYVLFLEAYFKLATLQLDREEWAAASYNLSRAAACLQTTKDALAANTGLREQLLQYQTECFAHLHNERLCRYFGQRTLHYFPHNYYVRPFLAALPAGRPQPRR